MRGVLTVVLAGGKGTRLEPLTRDRAKPGVPFGGQYRIIDFTLSNCINSGLRKILVLTQFKSRSLDLHLRAGWNFLSPELGESIEVLPPQQRIDETWYKGTADAIYQNIYSMEREDSELTLILAGDHIYKMDYGRMLRAHRDRGADATVGCIPVPLDEVKHFGVVQTTADDRVHHFLEKAEDGRRDARGRGPRPRVDGHLRLPDPPPVRPAVRGRGPGGQQARLRPEHPSPDDRRRAEGVRLPVPGTRTGSPSRTGGTWAPSTPTTRRTWT